MKNLLVAALISTVASASMAADAASAITLITQGTYSVASQAPHCPVGVQCAMVSRLYLNLPLNGCLDSAVVAYKTERTESGKMKVIVTALNVANTASRGARCVAAPTASKSITLGNGAISKDMVEVEFVTSLAN